MRSERHLHFLAACALTLLLAGSAFAAPKEAGPTEFLPWTKATFERARREERIVAVTVSTSWCHWCHVMKRRTWADSRVQARLRARFLPVDVDADQRPDLAERFRNYRWPATAFLTSDGTPILALRGYRSPEAFLQILGKVEALVRAGGPYPGFRDPGNAKGSLPGADTKALVALRTRAVRTLDRAWDPKTAGWGRGQKYPVSPPLEYGLRVGGTAEARALKTLRAMAPLLDRVDGGMYQYSLEGRWDRWHPEKIMEVNAGALIAYAEAYEKTGNAAFLKDALAIYRWIAETLRTSEGTFRTSQDADAPGLAGERYYRLPTRAAREPFGTPRVDGHVYARENGRAAQALVAFHQATGEQAYYTAAKTAVTWILKTHSIQTGLLVHDAREPGETLFLLDHVEMGRALLALHQADGNEAWLTMATRIAEAMVIAFATKTTDVESAPATGFHDGTADPAAPGYLSKRRMSLEGNARAARFLLTLAQIQTSPLWRRQALGAVREAARGRRLERHGRNVGDLLVALEQALAPYATITVYGPEDDAAATSLWNAARREALAAPWTWVRRQLGQGAGATVCTAQGCSPMARTPEELRRELLARRPAFGR